MPGPDLFERCRLLMDDSSRYLAQGAAEDREPLESRGPGDRLSGASQGESKARRPGAVNTGLSSATRVQVYSISAFRRDYCRGSDP